MAFGFARYDLTQITRRLELLEVSPDPKKPITLIVRGAGEGNRAWTSAVFRRPTEPQAERSSPWHDEAGRERIAEIFAESIIVGWENVFDDQAPTEPVPFSVEAVQGFLVELITHAPDVWRRCVFDPVFNKGLFRPSVDPVDLGKG